MPNFGSPSFQRIEQLEKSLIHWKSNLEKSEKQVKFDKKTIVSIQKELEDLGGED